MTTGSSEMELSSAQVQPVENLKATDAAAAMLPKQKQIFEQYQNARLNNQGRVQNP